MAHLQDLTFFPTPQPPTAVIAGNVGGMTADIFWTASVSTVTTYNLLYRVTGTQTWTTIDTGLATSYRLTALTLGTAYDVVVICISSDGIVSAFSTPTVTFTTSATITIPGEGGSTYPGTNVFPGTNNFTGQLNATNVTVSTGMILPFATTGFLQVNGSGVVTGGGGAGSGATLGGNNIFTGTNNFTGGLAQNGNNFSIAGALTTAGAFTTTGAFSITLAATATTSLTLPTSGTLISDTTGGLLAGANTWTNTNNFTGGLQQSGRALTLGSSTNTLALTTSGNTSLALPTTGTVATLEGVNTWTSTNTFAAVIASVNSTAYGTSAFTVRNVSNTNNQVYMGYNSSTNAGYIQSITQGTGGRTLLLNPSGGAVALNSATSTITLASSFATAGAFALTLTTTAGTNVTLPTTGTLTTLATVVAANNTWTGTNNFTSTLSQNSNAISLAGALTTAGALSTSGGNALTLTTTADSNVTFPTTGTLATTTNAALLAGANTFTNTNNFTGGLSQSGNALSFGGAFTLSGASPVTFFSSGITSITLPTGGTLATTTNAGLLAGSNTWSGSNNFTGTLSQNSNAISLAGALTTAGSFTTSGANALTITTTGPTNVTFPTSGTLLSSGSVPTLAGANTFTNTNNFTGGLQQSGRALTLGSSTDTLTINTAGNTSITVPTSGTLAALGGANTWTSTNLYTGLATFSIDSVAYTTAALLVRNTTNTNNQVYLGYNSSTNVGYIQSITQGTGTRPLLLNPSGGAVAINSASTTITLGGSFTTSGASALTLTTTGATNVTLPTSGTLVTTTTAPTLAGANTFTNTNNFTGGLAISGNLAVATDSNVNSVVLSVPAGSKTVTVNSTGNMAYAADSTVWIVNGASSNLAVLSSVLLNQGNGITKSGNTVPILLGATYTVEMSLANTINGGTFSNYTISSATGVMTVQPGGDCLLHNPNGSAMNVSQYSRTYVTGVSGSPAIQINVGSDTGMQGTLTVTRILQY